MVIYTPAVYRMEREIHQCFEWWLQLPYVRIGLVTDHGHPANALSPYDRIPYGLIVAYAKVHVGGPPIHRLHRVAYIRCGDFGRDGSDNLADPLSFKVGIAETAPPQSFVLPDHGPLGTVKAEVSALLRAVRARWDSHYRFHGVTPPRIVPERFGETYFEPTY